jgi:hypothetical protein
LVRGTLIRLRVNLGQNSRNPYDRTTTYRGVADSLPGHRW